MNLVRGVLFDKTFFFPPINKNLLFGKLTSSKKETQYNFKYCLFYLGLCQFVACMALEARQM